MRRTWRGLVPAIAPCALVAPTRAPTRLRLDASTPNRLTVVALFDDGREVPVERREEGGGVILVVPAYMSVRNWFLYRRLGPAG